LDAAKSGDVIRPEVFKEDRKAFGHPRGPKWREIVKETDRLERNKSAKFKPDFLQRPKELKEFIMDRLHRKTKTTYDDWCSKAQQKCIKDPDGREEKVLSDPWYEAKERCHQRKDGNFKHDLDAIWKHVMEVEETHRQMIGNGSDFTKNKIEVRQDRLRAVSKKFHSFPTIDDMKYLMDQDSIRRLRASCAYAVDEESRRYSSGRKWSRFPWDVAYQDLCDIKARSTGAYNSVISAIHDSQRIPSSMLS
jgi:RNA-dependent RNA polymerase